MSQGTIIKQDINMGGVKIVTKEWNRLKTDKDRWIFVMWNKKWFRLKLDNDKTYVYFSSFVSANHDIDDLPELNNFDKWIGKSHGIFILLEILNIEAECV